MRSIVHPGIVLSVLFALTIAAVIYFGEPAVTTEPIVNLSLPDFVGDWRGRVPVYCQNMSCRNKYFQNEAEPLGTCPKCGSELGFVSPIERAILPKDTVIIRKEYQNSAGNSIMVSVVVTGTQRASIHRPEWCLPAQGFVIDRARKEKIELRGRKPLAIMLLDLSSEGTRTPRPSHAFAYWFVGRGRETPYHIVRLFWMAVDSVFRGVVQKWAYVAVMTSDFPVQDAETDTLLDFVGELYPAISNDTSL